MLIQAALNGLRDPARFPQVPVTLEQLAAEAQAAVAAGAGALHVHVRDSAGQECLAAADVRRTVLALRAACPGVPLGVSTGAWIVPDTERRLALLERWDVVPDYASVNFDEDGALAVVDLLNGKGVMVEAGLATIAAAETFVGSGRSAACLRVLIEPGEPTIAAAQATVAAIERRLDAAGIGLPRLLHGADATAWPLLQDALARGLDTRIGFEDTLALPNGRPAAGNGALVLAARALLPREGA